MERLSLNDLDRAAEFLCAGKVLVYPTETSYALGCDATNDVTVARIFAIKGREAGKGLPLILPPEADPKEFVDFSDTAVELANRFWPGALNIVASRQAWSIVSPYCTTDDSQSIRKSAHPVAAELARLLGKPIVATSANRSGQPALYGSADVIGVFAVGQAPDVFLDAGDLPETPASTTVRVVGDKIEVVRQGTIIL